MGFESFIGNSRMVERLRAKLAQNRFPHALIFDGPEGVGKRTMALMIAKALNCTVKGPDDFCDECTHCRKITNRAHPDVMLISTEEEATQIKIDQIRYVLSLLSFQPMEGRNKVFVIDPANLLNPQASNALLKGLEEPPENSFFILLSVNLHELLVTIRSRCQVYHFAPLGLAEIRSRGITDELAVRWSQGSIGRAQSFDAAGVKEQRETVIHFLEAAVDAKDDTLREMLNASGDLSRSKQDFGGHLAVMAVVLADILYISEGSDDKIVNIDIHERLGVLAAKAPVERWIRVAEFLGEIELGMKGYLNRQIMTDALSLITSSLSE